MASSLFLKIIIINDGNNKAKIANNKSLVLVYECG